MVSGMRDPGILYNSRGLVSIVQDGTVMEEIFLPGDM